MRFYRALLHLYPSSFRAEYGGELVDVFAARRAGERGFGVAVATVLLAIADIVPNAIAEHLEILRQDLRYTRRALRNAPGFAITAVLVVALGVGANTAAFSVADFALLRPLPFPNPDQIVKVWERPPQYGQMEFSPGNFRDLKAGATSFSAIGAYVTTAVNLVGDGDPVRLEASPVTLDVLPLLGAKPFVGRTFSAADTVAGDAVILSYPLWQTQFGSDETLIGRRIVLDGAPHTVIGVMPRGFAFPSRTTALWTPLAFAMEDFDDRANTYLKVVGRLKDGVSVDRARAEANVIAAQAERQFPKANKNTRATLYQLGDEKSERSRLLLMALCGATLCILLLACANLASLLIARAASREREIAVRAALGAGRERLIRQVVTESLTLAAIGGAVGVFVAMLLVPALSRLIPDTLPVGQVPTVDLRILAFAAVTIAVTGLGFGVVPALRAGSPAAMRALRDGARSGGGRKQRVRALLVSVEVMASVVLLVSSGLLVRAMWKLQSLDPGFQTAGVLTARTALPFPRYADPLVRAQYYDRVLASVRALPGVKSAAFTSFLPMAMGGGIWPVIIPGREAPGDGSNRASLRFSTPQFFSALRIPIRRGRDIATTDEATRPYVAVVSESFAEHYWPGEDPLGKHFSIGLHDRLVVGVSGDIRVRGFEQTSEPQVYVSSKQVETGWLIFYTPKDIVIRTTSSTSALVPALRRIVHDADPQQPVSDIRTMDEIVGEQTAPRLAQLRVLGVLAAIALLLAGVGIHGLLSFTVSRRAQEIGVRMALGAESREIVLMVMREGLALALLGILPGVAVAYVAGRAMQALLAGVQPGDGLTIAVAVALCALTTIVGCVRPAMRASRVDPMSALRAE